MLILLLAAVSGPSDADLVRRFKEGDRSAYAEIVRRYQHRVYSLCLRWMGDDQVAANDVSDAQLSALQFVLANGLPPYTDFAIFEVEQHSMEGSAH